MKKEDLELLELAAKAVGITTYRADYGLVLRSGRVWNPLANGDDALSLAVRLGMTVRCPVRQDGRDCASVTVRGINFQEQDDPYIATRRAIVCAAAAIGKTMGGTTAAAGACACIGPEKGQTLCPCDLRRKAAQ